MQPSGDSSLLKMTDQSWKLNVLFGAFALSAPLMIYALWRIDSLGAGPFFRLMLAGMALALGGLLFASLAIRCPNCRNRWFWTAISTQHSGAWLHSLQTMETCPDCGFSSREPD